MRIIDILRKDLKIILSDRKALASMIIMPIILSTILGFALSGSFMSTKDGNVSKFHIAIVKNYSTDKELKKVNESLLGSIIGENLDYKEKDELIKSSKELDIEKIFFEEFLGNDELRKIVQYRIEDKGTAMKLLENKEIAAIVVLPENFIYDMTINFLTPFRNIVKIDVIGNPQNTIGFQVTEGIMTGFTDMTSSMIIGKNVFIEAAFEEGINQRVFKNMESIVQEITNNIENLKTNIDYVTLQGKEPISSFQYYAAAMGTMFILFAAGYGSRALLEEKHNITYQRMIVAGTSRLKILIGKFFMIFLFALLQIFIMILYSIIFFKVNWGDLGLIFIISLCTVFSIAGLGTMIAAATFKAGNYKMSAVFENIIIQGMALVGGSFIPFEILPKFMQKLGMLSINGMALRSYLKCMMGYGIGEIKLYLLMLLGLGILFTVCGVMILKSKGGLRNA